MDAHEDDLFIDFDLSLDSTGSGSLHLYIGTVVAGSLEPSDLEPPGDIGRYDNQNLIRVMEGFGPHMEDRVELFRSILDTSSDVVLHDLVYMNGNETDVFALSLDVSFSFNESGSWMEYRYLNFLRSIPLPYAQEGDRYAEMWRDREIERMRRCVVSIRFDLDKELSLDLQNEGGDHHRSPSGESLDRRTDLYELITNGNGFIVSDLQILSPFWMFVITVLVTVGGYIGLGIIWWRNMFRKLGLILPISALAVSLLPIFIYFNPQLNGYSLMDIFLLTSFIFYIGLVITCNFVNPRGKESPRTYDEEKGPGFEMPKVVYREKNVYIKQAGHEGIDPYDILGVTRSMPMGEITARYKQQILKFHPDKFADTSDRIREISARETERLNQAYELVSRERSG